ncbi:MAG: OmpH family outer membrane protein [Verrucomicrobiales bacterium]|nr:OmpH family outer membrane protein [Verrucomicrobiales bacterium]
MITSLTRTLLAGAAAAVLALSAQAQPKLAVLNMKTVFDGYWKTVQSDTTIKERQGEFEKERKKMADDYERLNAEYREAEKTARDPLLSGDEQKKRKEAANNKLLEIREIEQSVRSFEANFDRQIKDQIRRMRENIFRDIREQVDGRAKAAGYNLVVNTAAESVDVPVFMYVAGLPDLTQEVLTELNRNAPPGVLESKKPAATTTR